MTKQCNNIWKAIAAFKLFSCHTVLGCCWHFVIIIMIIIILNLKYLFLFSASFCDATRPQSEMQSEQICNCLWHCSALWLEITIYFIWVDPPPQKKENQYFFILLYIKNVSWYIKRKKDWSPIPVCKKSWCWREIWRKCREKFAVISSCCCS